VLIHNLFAFYILIARFVQFSFPEKRERFYNTISFKKIKLLKYDRGRVNGGDGGVVRSDQIRSYR
jgi:hypothetical protein